MEVREYVKGMKVVGEFGSERCTEML